MNNKLSLLLPNTRNYIYIAGPYMGIHTHDSSSYLQIEQNILNAKIAMRDLVSLGYGVFCPHAHSAHFEVITSYVQPSYWYDLDLYFMQLCQGLLCLPGKSTGAEKEVEMFLSWDRPVFYSIEDLKATMSPYELS